jgi:hypothetical protein
MTTTKSLSTRQMILVPALVTLAVTLLRLTGELMHWSPKLFSPAAGGGGALVGIAWLVPVFGVYFAVKLVRAGESPAGVGAAIGLAVLAFALLPFAGFAAAAAGLPQQSLTMFGLFIVLSIVGAFIAYRGWPALGRTLLAYGLAARIPVVVVMLVAMLGNWGTHYDVAPPGFPAMGTLAKWFAIGVLPQLTIWIWFTMAAGAIAGTITAAVLRAKRPASA